MVLLLTFSIFIIFIEIIFVKHIVERRFISIELELQATSLCEKQMLNKLIEISNTLDVDLKRLNNTIDVDLKKIDDDLHNFRS